MSRLLDIREIFPRPHFSKGVWKHQPSSLPLYSLYYAKACNEFAGPISVSLHPGNTAPFEEMSQQWRVVANSVSDLTGPRLEPQTSRSKGERHAALLTGR